VAESNGIETLVEGEQAEISPEEFPSEYTTESTASAEAPARRPITTGNSYGTGRRKQAVARVRIVPGTGKWTINGRSLDAYFPNKVHQQIVNEPFVVLGAEDAFDVLARIDGGGVTGQAGALRMGLSRALTALDSDGNRAPLKKARKAPQYSKR